MELRDTPDEAAFRQEVRDFIAADLPDESKQRGARRFEDADSEWSRRLGEAGYAGLTWPKEYGGAGAPYSHQAIFLEELARAEAPSHLGVIGLGMAGPTIMAWGTDEQKERYLSKILMADEIWCQGFSEPDAGSDLAASRTRIEDKGDHFLVNGQKVWSSFAHIADFCILIGLGDPDAPRYRNLTYVIVDMHSPGVEVRPLVQITGQPEFNEIFFTDVKVPKENLLGEVGEGWQVAMTTLLHERGTLGFALSATLAVAVGKLIALAKERRVTDPILRDRIAREWIELQALKYTNYRSLTTLQKTGIPGPEGSASKLVLSVANQRLTKLAVDGAARRARVGRNPQERRLLLPRCDRDLRGARTRPLRRAVRAQRSCCATGGRGVVDRDRRVRAAPPAGDARADGRDAGHRRI